ncbi:hypothetical protein BDV93DRAFT_282965 [Ceratobasidium sp. AG-I]|nr:hypothetical protein BDV93DRAFT_282965 [Ceratobasidium sp. AG-I]
MSPPNSRYKVKPKRHHAYTGFIFVIGFLLPPFAVAARFGVGKDFWINVLLTVCGYVPGQIHNFYIQTVRNNKNSKRTPQWAVRNGLVDDSTIKRHKKRSQWSHRLALSSLPITPLLRVYNDRLPQSALDGAEFAPDQVPDTPPPAAPTPAASTIGGARSPAALWREDDSEGFYDRTKVEAPRGSKPRKGNGWRFDGGFPDEDATTGIGGSIYTGASIHFTSFVLFISSSFRLAKKPKRSAYFISNLSLTYRAVEPERRPKKKRSNKHSRQSSIDSPRYGSRVWEDPLAGGGDIVPRPNGSPNGSGSAGAVRVGDGMDHQF